MLRFKVQGSRFRVDNLVKSQKILFSVTPADSESCLPRTGYGVREESSKFNMFWMPIILKNMKNKNKPTLNLEPLSAVLVAG